MMNGKEKLYFLLDAIEDARVITPSGQPLAISALSDLNRRLSAIELFQLFTKLEKDEQVLKLLREPNRVKTALEGYDLNDKLDDGRYHFELLPAFDEYYLKIQNEPEYQEFAGKKPSSPQVQNKAQPKYNRKALEKIWNLLQEIEEKRQLCSEGDEIQIQKYPYGNNVSDWDAYYQERKTILPRLVSLGAIKDLKDGELLPMSMTNYTKHSEKRLTKLILN